MATPVSARAERMPKNTCAATRMSPAPLSARSDRQHPARCHLRWRWEMALRTKKASSRSRTNPQRATEGDHQPSDEDADERAYQRAIRFLAARPRSVVETRRRLRLAHI